MIYFPPLRTARLDVQLRELTLREAVDLAATPLNSHHAATSALLARVVESAEGVHSNPGRWTVQERMLAVAHYIAATSEGAGNFAIGELTFLDYLDDQRDAAPDVVDAGQACGDTWQARQITGDEAIAMEQVCSSHLDWVTADVAARMVVVGAEEGRPDATAKPAEFAAWLSERMGVIQAMPESTFEELFAAYRRSLETLQHLFWLEFDEEGPFVLPKMKEGGAALAPARFLVSSCIGQLARILGPRADRTSDLP